jgi:hypothetical protein
MSRPKAVLLSIGQPWTRARRRSSRRSSAACVFRPSPTMSCARNALTAASSSERLTEIRLARLPGFSASRLGRTQFSATWVVSCSLFGVRLGCTGLDNTPQHSMNSVGSAANLVRDDQGGAGGRQPARPSARLRHLSRSRGSRKPARVADARQPSILPLMAHRNNGAAMLRTVRSLT